MLIHNDFNGDDPDDYDPTGKAIEGYAYIFTQSQIVQLSDFFTLSGSFLFNLVLVNPLLYTCQAEPTLQLMFDAIKKLSRFCAFLKANHSIFTTGPAETEWINRFSTMMETVTMSYK